MPLKDGYEMEMPPAKTSLTTNDYLCATPAAAPRHDKNILWKLDGIVQGWWMAFGAVWLRDPEFGFYLSFCRHEGGFGMDGWIRRQ